MAIWAGLDLDMAGDSSNKLIKNFRLEAFAGVDRPSTGTYDPAYHKSYMYYDEDNENVLFGRDAKAGAAAGFYVIADTTSNQPLANKTMQSVVLESISRATGDAIIDDLTTVASPTDKIASIAGIKAALAGYISNGLTLSGHITGTESDGDISTTIQPAAITDQATTALASDDTFLFHDTSGNALGKATLSDLYTAIHPTGFASTPDPALTDLSVISQVVVNSDGHVTGTQTRELPASTITDGQGLTWTHDTVNNILTGDVHLTPFTTDDLTEGATNLYFHNELVDDRVAQLLNAGTGIILNYSDATNTLTISADPTGVNYWTKTGSDLKYIEGNVYIGEDGNASDLYVWGSIYQNGDPYILEAEHIRTSDEFMVLRYDAAAAIGAGDISGLQVTKYDGTNDLIFGAGNDGWFRIGEAASLQLIATRDENANIVDGNLLVLDEATNKLIDSGLNPSNIGGAKHFVVDPAASTGSIVEDINLGGHGLGVNIACKFMFYNGTTWSEVYGIDYTINSSGDISWSANPSFKGKIYIIKSNTAI